MIEELSPFSLHNIVSEGVKTDRKPGDWYGPQAISYVLKRLNKKFDPVENFVMMVCGEGTLYFDELERKSKNWTKSVFVSYPTRLGLNYIEPEYLEGVKEIFTIP
jgi:hypothetical protein